MKSFIDYSNDMILEALADDFPEIVKGDVRQLFLGRLQPVHLGHAAILKMMKKPVVILVKGAKSGEDKTRNPLDAKYQAKLIKMIDKNAKVVIAPTGYVPQMIADLRDEGIEINQILAGNDRIGDYKKQIDGINKKLSKEQKITVKFVETPRVASATDVRAAIRDDNQAEFEKLTPKVIHKEYAKLRKLIK